MLNTPLKISRAGAPLHRLVLALLLATSVQLALAADPKASRFYEHALIRYEKQDLPGAVIQLKNALKADKTLLSVHVLLGKVLLAMGDVVAAEVAFDEAMKLGVNATEVVVSLAEAIAAQGKPDQVLSQSRLAHAGLPAGVQARLLMIKAAAASDLGNGRDAIKFIEEARALGANNAESWVAEVPIRIRARQAAEAKAAADKAVALDPISPQAAYQQATVAHVSGDLKSALVMYTRTLDLKASHIDARVARAGLYIDSNRMEEAAVDVKAARSADPKDPRSTYLSALLAERAGNKTEVRVALNEVTNLIDPLPMQHLRYRPQVLMLGGLAHFGLDQGEKAKPYLEMLLRQDGNSPVAKLLAQIYLKENRVDKAIEALESYLRTHGSDMQATLLLASAQMAQGRHARAAQLMQESLKRVDDPSMRAVLGRSLVGAGKFDTGAAELEAALKKDPDQIQAGVTLTGLYLASGQAGKAVGVASALFKRHSASPGLANLLGSALVARGDAAGARKAFEQALRLDPGFVEPQINLARIDIDAMALDAALTRLDAVIAKDERNVDAALEIARLNSARGRTDDAERWLMRAEDHSGPRLQAGLQLVEFQLARSRADLAREALRRLQNKAPEALVVLLTQARVLMANKDLPAARATLTRATTLASYDAASLVQIARLQLAGDNVPGAAHALDKALAERPGHLAARALRANVFVLQGDTAKAETLARAVLASDPKLGLGHGLMGDVARARKQFPAAIDAYRRAHEIDQSSESLLRLFGALESTQRPSAVALAQRWLHAKPADLRVLRALADTHARSGEMAAARKTYEQAIKVAPEDSEALNNLANVLIAMADPAALAVAERALAQRPHTPHIIGTTGWAAFHAKQPERALQLLCDARLRDPTNPNTRYFLGAVLAQQGRKTEAREELEGALRGGQGQAYASAAEVLLKTLR